MNIFSGVKVVDFTHAYAGPFCSLSLADFGAEVIKIERVLGGDQARSWGPFKNGYSGYYASFNRGKKSLTLNIASEEGRKIIFDLVKDADIVCSNFKAGTLENYGIGYEDIRKVKPDIIYSVISGFGSKGELSKFAAYDNVVQAMSGIMDLNGFPGERPTKIGPAIGDNYTGLLLLMGTIIAYYHRLRTGEGQVVDVSMLGALFSMAEQAVMEYANNGREMKRIGNANGHYAPGDVFKVKDGFLGLSVFTEEMWSSFCSVLGCESLAEEPRYATNADRLHNQDALRADLERVFANLTRDAIEKRLEGTGIPVGGVINIIEALENPQLLARDMVISVPDPVMGPIKLVGNPIKLSGFEPVMERPSPTLGQHTDEILRSMGYGEEKIADLRMKAVISR